MARKSGGIKFGRLLHMAMYKNLVVSYKLVCVTSYPHAHARRMSAARVRTSPVWMHWRRSWQMAAAYEDMTSTRAHECQGWEKCLCERGHLRGHLWTKILEHCHCLVYSTQFMPTLWSTMLTKWRLVPGCFGNRINILNKNLNCWFVCPTANVQNFIFHQIFWPYGNQET